MSRDEARHQGVGGRFREVTLAQNHVLAKVERFRRGEVRRGIAAACAGCSGLEIGGPSPIFGQRGLLPIYPELSHLDSCDFAESTIWDSQQHHTPEERCFVGEATAIPVADRAYEVLLASHVLEHSANALRALAEWRRVVTVGGSLVLILPHKDFIFDHRRPSTTIEHFEEDDARGTDEHDLSHLPEVLSLHDSRHDFFDGSSADFTRRGQDNFRVRALHHHVFTTASVYALLTRAGLEVHALLAMRFSHIAAFCRNPEHGASIRQPTGVLEQALLDSPFPSDKG